MLVNYTLGNNQENKVRGKSYMEFKGDGIYQSVQHYSHRITRKIANYDFIDKDLTSLPFMPKGSGEEITVEYALDEKIPFVFIVEMLNFYKKVHKEVQTEASVHLFYLFGDTKIEDVADIIEQRLGKQQREVFLRGTRQYGKFFAYAPLQRNTGVVTIFNMDKVFKELRQMEEVTIVCETHSHHTMSAFWSGTDLANQKDNYYYLVVGNINKTDDILAKKVVEGDYENIPLTEIVDVPYVEISNTSKELEYLLDLNSEREYLSGVMPFKEDGFKQEWLEQILSHNFSMKGMSSNEGGYVQEEEVEEKEGNFETGTYFKEEEEVREKEIEKEKNLIFNDVFEFEDIEEVYNSLDDLDEDEEYLDETNDYSDEVDLSLDEEDYMVGDSSVNDSTEVTSKDVPNEDILNKVKKVNEDMIGLKNNENTFFQESEKDSEENSEFELKTGETVLYSKGIDKMEEKSLKKFKRKSRKTMKLFYDINDNKKLLEKTHQFETDKVKFFLLPSNKFEVDKFGFNHEYHVIVVRKNDYFKNNGQELNELIYNSARHVGIIESDDSVIPYNKGTKLFLNLDEIEYVLS